MKIKEINFIPNSIETEKIFSGPVPAKKNIPVWYKDIKSNYLINPEFSDTGIVLNNSVKSCMPFLDAFTIGYVQKTWCDIYIKKENNQINYHYSVKPEILSARKKTNIKLFDKEFYPIEFVWKNQWSIKTPKDYSILICHPLNRQDLPFYTLSGIIDSDLYHHAKIGQFPFFIKNNFEGLIPVGTPMFQIIPIKRDKWKSKNIKFSFDIEKRSKIRDTRFWEFYKKNMWQKKEYE